MATENNREERIVRKNKAYFVIGFLLCLFIVGGGMYFYPHEPIIQIKEKEVIKEVPIYEQSVNTAVFITHLNPRIDPVIAGEIANAVDECSKRYCIPKKLILGIIYKESKFNPLARSKVAFGLMQIYPKFHRQKIKDMGIDDDKHLYHIDINIELGCQVFYEYYSLSNGNLDETFHKYLSKDASEELKDKYKSEILETWARLEFLEYQLKGENDVQEIKN